MSTAELRNKPTTLEQLLGSSYEGWCEIVDGELERVHMSPFTSRVAFLLGLRLGEHCERTQVATVFESETYYRCFGSPKTGRKPDLSVILKDRLPPDWEGVGFFSIPPDLAVEVVSPQDRADRVQKKIREYREAGVRLLWVIYPQTRLAAIYYPGGYEEVTEEQELTGRDVLPEFRVRLGDLFPSNSSPPTEKPT